MPDLPSAGRPPLPRTVFFVSDGTGITAETFGHSLLSQFDGVEFNQVRMPFIDTLEKAGEVIQRIARVVELGGARPIVFSTLVNPAINLAVRASQGLFLDLIQTFIEPLEKELGAQSSHSIGRSHNMSDSKQYNQRIEAINFALAHDDGQLHKGLQKADVILIGVSRSGKTPTSLYLAMQYGIKAANYPLIPEDFERNRLPSVLPEFKSKLFGLSISPERLAEVRNERRPGSKYASLENCRYEVNEAEALMRRESIHWLSSTTKSIEEIATTILQDVRLDSRGF
ncbi:MAG: pyruvate, water dikinase regulatory protein [Burkholderiaceae bacterium]|jgi:regulator of PEP synthase PpsR (kinase-PPPase family)